MWRVGGCGGWGVGGGVWGVRSVGRGEGFFVLVLLALAVPGHYA